MSSLSHIKTGIDIDFSKGGGILVLLLLKDYDYKPMLSLCSFCPLHLVKVVEKGGLQEIPIIHDLLDVFLKRKSYDKIEMYHIPQSYFDKNLTIINFHNDLMESYLDKILQKSIKPVIETNKGI